MTEKSPLDTLNELHQMLSALTAKVSLMEQNIHLLHDKANGTLFGAPRAQLAPQIPTITSTGSNIMSDLDGSQRVIGVPIASQAVSQAAQTNDARVHGKVFSPDKRPVQGVAIIIKNQKNELLEQPKTNIGGEWEVRLPVGKYALTYSKAGMSPVYKFVEVKSGQRELEIV